MKKLKDWKLFAMEAKLTKEQMKKINGGYGQICGGLFASCAPIPCCPGFPCRWNQFAQEFQCGG